MKKELENYVTPQCEVLELELEGMIAASLGDNDDYVPGEGSGITFP